MAHSLAERFFVLFAGLERSHGRYLIPIGAKSDDKGKLHDPKWAWTEHGPITVELWEAHLTGLLPGRSGSFGIGVVPIRDDGTCVFGAVDVDVYPLDLLALHALVKKMELPLIVTRTKSGGAHLYLFLSEPASAELVRSKLMEWSVALGYPGVEVFPKQTRLASEKDDGSWINIPYNAGTRSTRYALRGDGRSMTPEEFLKAAEAIAVTPQRLDAWELPEDEVYGEFLEEGPPCLQTLARRGFGDWQNNGMFNIAVYLRKRFGENWEGKADEYNRRLLSPPLNHADLGQVVKSVNKKKYSYMCKQEPICGVCNKQVCLTRDFGVGGLGDDPGVVFGELVKVETDPPVWIWDVNGARIELTNDDLMDQRKFHRLAISVLNVWPNLIKPGAWQQIVRERLARVTVVQVPKDATKEGQFWAHVERFCTSKVQGKNMDELLLGKPYTNAAEGRTYFRSPDLFQYLQQHRFSGASERDVFGWMRKHEVGHHFLNLKGTGVNCWSVPAFSQQTEEHAVPRSKPPERM